MSLWMSIFISICFPISFYINVMRLRFHSTFLFGCRFAISLDCYYYYLSLLWYCNGFQCQGQIAKQYIAYTHNLLEEFIITIIILSVFSMPCKVVFWCGVQVDDNCILFIQFIRYKYENNMKWHRLTMRFCFSIFANFLLFWSI